MVKGLSKKKIKGIRYKVNRKRTNKKGKKKINSKECIE